MTRGPRRRLIPVESRDLGLWPEPDERALPDDGRERYLRRRRAVEMYAEDCPYDDIRCETDISEDEVQRLVKRCVAIHPAGEIYGFRALLPGVRLKDYERQAAVLHVKGAGPGGCSGALEQLLSKYPEIRALIHQLYFNDGNSDLLPEASMPVTRIHGRFKAALRKLGLTEHDWPFNTDNCGYQALWAYCHALRQLNS